MAFIGHVGARLDWGFQFRCSGLLSGSAPRRFVYHSKRTFGLERGTKTVMDRGRVHATASGVAPKSDNDELIAFRRAASMVALIGLGTMQLACGFEAEDPPEDPNTVKIGALLPFTGELAHSGANIERSIMWVAEKVNAEGGVAGRPVRIITRDSNSSVERGMKSVRELIEDENVVAIIGPEYEELAKAMLPVITEHKVIVVSGGVTSPAFTDLDTEEFWFRTTPTATAFGSVLADAAYEDGVERLAIVYVDDEYGKGFANSVRQAYDDHEGVEFEMIPFAAGASSYRQTLRAVQDFDPDGIALVSYPRTGATIVSDWSSLNRRVKWYFSNSLRAEEFIQNVPPDSVEGAIGTSHSFPRADASVFSGQFGDRWDGDTPLPASYFNYDALAVLLLAIEEAHIENDTIGVPTAHQIRPHLEHVSSTSRGKSVSWHDLARGLELVRLKNVPSYAGINYRGVSGFVDMDEHGDIFAGLVQFWTVEDGLVVPGHTVTPRRLEGD